MVYENKLDLINFNQQNTVILPDPQVIIEFNGSGIHKIAGPTPLISLSSSYNRSGAGQLESIERKIKLDGKIVRSSNRNFTQDITPDSTGVMGLVEAHEALKDLFSECSAGTLSIYCEGNKFFEKHNVRVESIEFSSEDNFIQVADYSVDLSFTEPAPSGYAVKNTVDEWNIEPLEDYVYMQYNAKIDKKPELHNPNAITDNGIPVERFTPFNKDELLLLDVPRYKISRKLSAIGLPSSSNITGCTNAGVNSAFIEAKNWVQSRLFTAFDDDNNKNSVLNSGLPAVSKSPGYTNFGPTYLYNHVRSINYSITEGSYGVTESWLAMPTAIKYTEDYDIDISTDENYIKTVTVKGEIQGLYLKNFDTMIGSGGSGLPPNNTLISLDYDTLETNNLNTNTIIANNKYENALSGFLYDIKPYLYSRASMGLNNTYYTDEFLDNSTVDIGLGRNRSNAPQIRNPTYVKEAQLNIIPISTTEAHNPRKGSVGYTYQFNNKANFITGVISSNITVDTNFPNDIFAESFVLGRALGPVLQDLGTISSAKKTVNVEVNVIPPKNIDGFLMTNEDCPLFTGGYIFSTITGIIEALKPYGDQQAGLGFSKPRLNDSGKVFVSSDSESWNPTQGKYNLQISYVYQPCVSSRSFRNT